MRAIRICSPGDPDHIHLVKFSKIKTKIVFKFGEKVPCVRRGALFNAGAGVSLQRKAKMYLMFHLVRSG